MTVIRDRQLKSVYANLETQRATDSSVTINAGNLVKLLAGAADTSSRTAARMEQELSAPGITREQQVDLTKRGMSQTEKKDFVAMLDQGTVPMTDEVRRFLEQVVGRTPVEPSDGALHVLGDQAGGILKGNVSPGATIEAINLSTSPNKRLHTTDTFVLAQAGADGKFTGTVPDMKEGDIIRLRARDTQGNVGNWLTLRASGMGADTRNADVALFRFGLSDAGNGKVNVVNINASRQISEPGAKIQFVNTRSNEKTLVTLDAEGTFPANLTIPGRPGDTFSIRASDGKNNLAFTDEVGKVQVPGGQGGTTGTTDLPDPALHKDELNADGTPRFHAKRFSGPLFKDGCKPEDVKQGQLGDCYLPSAVAALAKSHPEVLQDIIKSNPDGTFTVSFKERQGWYGTTYKDKPITVDGDLYARSWGGPLYGASAGDTSEKNMELWWPIFEKAYAQWKGSYNAIGNGGRSSDVFEAVLGRATDDMSLGYASKDAVWAKVKGAVDGKTPICAGTFGESEEARYTNTGVYANHSYSVLGYAEKNGERYVTLRNPWGESEPFPGDGKNDGIFNLKLDDFMRLYSTLYTVD